MRDGDGSRGRVRRGRAHAGRRDVRAAATRALVRATSLPEAGRAAMTSLAGLSPGRRGWLPLDEQMIADVGPTELGDVPPETAVV